MGKSAILLGATGLTGNHLLDLLLADANYSKIIVLTRRSTEKKHPKLEEHIVDVLALENHSNLLKGDIVFCCIGTTKVKTPDKELYHKIDYGIPLTTAKLAIRNNVKRLLIISSPGANPKSRIFYSRTKGEMERDVLEVVGKEVKVHFLHPSLIVGNRQEKRIGEGVANKLMTFFDFLIPLQYKKI